MRFWVLGAPSYRVKLHPRVDCLASHCGDIGPPDFLIRTARHARGVKDPGVSGKAGRNHGADYEFLEGVPTLTDPVSSFDLAAR
jgi:hypothetical protein